MVVRDYLNLSLSDEHRTESGAYWIAVQGDAILDGDESPAALGERVADLSRQRTGPHCVPSIRAQGLRDGCGLLSVFVSVPIAAPQHHGKRHRPALG